jgi:ribulose-bisphosphate carboxylase large chain
MLELSGQRWSVVYQLFGTEARARAVAEQICIEQTVEFPSDLLPAGPISEQLVGHVERLQRVDPDRFEATVSYAIETVGGELPQLLNVIMGNTSLKRGVRVIRLELPSSLLDAFSGPRFGRQGLRELLGVSHRPLLCTALKPMGLSAEQLSELAHGFALGGIDLIKDDHGLADQPFCTFGQRVARCAEAVSRANQATGGRSLYLPNVTAPADQLLQRARLAVEAGAGGLLVAPGLVGWDSVRRLADDDAIALPLMGHPALLGSMVVHPREGFSCFALMGQLMRLAGADACIFPHPRGRFPFSEQDCTELATGCETPMAHIRPILPVPAGGVSVKRVPELLAFYGSEVILLIGGDLRRTDDLVESCRRFRELVDRSASEALF